MNFYTLQEKAASCSFMTSNDSGIIWNYTTNCIFAGIEMQMMKVMSQYEQIFCDSLFIKNLQMCNTSNYDISNRSSMNFSYVSKL